jgi:hypothetical protein
MKRQFKIGDKIVSLVDGTETRVKKGDRFNVLDIMYCSKCGTQIVDIGFKEATYLKSLKCLCHNINLINYNNTKWCDNKYFIHEDDLECELVEAVENEDYEFAQVLKDIINGG